MDELIEGLAQADAEQELENEGEDGAASQTPVSATVPPVTTPAPQVGYSEEEIARLSNQIAQRLAPPPPEGEKDALKWATAKAEADGFGYDQEYILRLALNKKGDDIRDEVLGRLAPALVPIIQKNQVDSVAGSDSLAREYVEKYIGKVDLSDPTVVELVSRAAKSYASEKRPAQPNVESVGGGGASPVAKMSMEDREFAKFVNSVNATINEKAKIF